jgi:hypothetical protein
VLRTIDDVETHLVMSPYATLNIETETPYTPAYVESLADEVQLQRCTLQAEQVDGRRHLPGEDSRADGHTAMSRWQAEIEVGGHRVRPCRRERAYNRRDVAIE